MKSDVYSKQYGLSGFSLFNSICNFIRHGPILGVATWFLPSPTNGWCSRTRVFLSPLFGEPVVCTPHSRGFVRGFRVSADPVLNPLVSKKRKRGRQTGVRQSSPIDNRNPIKQNSIDSLDASNTND